MVQGVIQGIMAGISFIGAGVILPRPQSRLRFGADDGRNRVGDGRARRRMRAWGAMGDVAATLAFSLFVLAGLASLDEVSARGHTLTASRNAEEKVPAK